jgi:uncharacterized protein (DUF1015 family)
VPAFEPFAAVRYSPDRVDIAEVVAPPYDVISPDDRARLERRSPYNVVHVDLSRADAARNRYEAARCRFDDWLEEGILSVDEDPGFYVYRMGWRDEDGRPRQTSGLLGALQLDPDRAGHVLPHERTMAKPLDDRLRLLRACRVDVSPIWVLSLASGLDATALAPPTDPPLVRFTDEDGVHHRVWRMASAGAVDAVRATVASAPVVIADGHHRYETALAYQAERRAATANAPGPYDAMLAYVVPLDESEVGVRPIHRLVAGLPDQFPLVEALAASFTVEPIGASRDDLLAAMATGGALGLVVRGQAYLLTPRAHARGDELADSELLEAALGTLPAHTVTYHPDVNHVAALVDKGEAQAGFLMRPATVRQIAAAARAGRRLPQKTTFFSPKPRTGLVFRMVDR